MESTPFLLQDAKQLRNNILALEQTQGKRAQLWDLLKTSARSAPESFGWYVPFAAFITREKQDIQNARQLIFNYMEKLEPMSFCSGLQFHFWCFAFPHAKMALYFQWLCSVGAFSEEEIRSISAKFINYHYVNFYFGMRSKPEPDCVDNQAFSLCLSTAIVGAIFSRGSHPSHTAALMLRDALRRLPGMLGDMPVSGYSGEGSSYMDCVNGPAVPLTVETLEYLTGETGLLFRPFEPRGAVPFKVVEMVAREFMPGGLLLPWDNYGYQFGVRSTLAYGALKSGNPLFFDVLETECNWTYDIGIGWAYDDLVWTLIWWPDAPAGAETPSRSWFEPVTGAALVSKDNSRYAIQMWDESTPDIPTRAHVNPAAVLFNAFGYPLSADGSPTPGKEHPFQFADTWRSVRFLAIGNENRYNYGDGCCGAHSCLVIDGAEGMRAHKEYEQTAGAEYDAANQWVKTDVTPIYKENIPDVERVVRKTQLHCESFFTVEDLFEACKEHTVSSRFVLRPSLVPSNTGVKTRTPEGVGLHVFNLLNSESIQTSSVQNHPFKPDGECVTVDFVSTAARVHRLFVVFPYRDVEKEQLLTDFIALGDEHGTFTYEQACAQLASSTLVLPMKLPAFMEAKLPNWRTWWYKKTIQRQPGPGYIVLPAGMHNPQLYLNGEQVDLAAFSISKELIGPHVPLPAHLHGCAEIEMVLRVEVSVSHYDGGGDGTISMTGGAYLARPVQPEEVQSAVLYPEHIHITTNQREYTVPYTMMG